MDIFSPFCFKNVYNFTDDVKTIIRHGRNFAAVGTRFETMTKTFIILTSLLLLTAAVSGAQDVVVVKGYNIPPYDEAVKGFKAACGCAFTELVSSEMEEDTAIREIKKLRPAVVFAVGTEALSLVKALRTVPIVYAMVPDSQLPPPKEKNASGVSMNLSPERYLGELKKVLPGTRRVGMAFDPAKTGQYAKKAIFDAQSAGITLIAKEVHGPRDVLAAIEKMKNEIDVFWLLPDSTVVTPETIEYLFYFSFENRVPVLAFAEKYVHLGALMSLSIDVSDVGRQAGELARKALAGNSLQETSGPAIPEKTVLSINLRTAQKMSIPISKEIINNAKIVGKTVPETMTRGYGDE